MLDSCSSVTLVSVSPAGVPAAVQGLQGLTLEHYLVVTVLYSIVLFTNVTMLTLDNHSIYR